MLDFSVLLSAWMMTTPVIPPQVAAIEAANQSVLVAALVQADNPTTPQVQESPSDLPIPVPQPKVAEEKPAAPAVSSSPCVCTCPPPPCCEKKRTRCRLFGRRR